MWFLIALLIIPGDAQRGAQLFESQKCVSCHSVQGKGGKAAPDLGLRSARAFTPSLLASLMWNHAPQMWSAMEREGIPNPKLSEQQAADLYAYFFAFRYFERPGDAARGRQVFLSKKCGECHQPTEASAGGAPALVKWEGTGDAVSLARSMWNHAPRMRDEFAKRGIKWPEMNSQELTDLMVYVRSLPGSRNVESRFVAGESETGKSLFNAKGCDTCHRGSLALESGRLRARTLTDLAVGLWNHAPKMVQLPPDINDVEMRRLVGYLWSMQYFESPGSATRGAKVFIAKKCATCHGNPAGGAPPLTAKTRQLDAIEVVSGLWQHGPGMLAAMKAKKLEWPRFRNEEMADLLAYVNSVR
jgi:mono/diheme cytochrome c family protein